MKYKAETLNHINVVSSQTMRGTLKLVIVGLLAASSTGCLTSRIIKLGSADHFRFTQVLEVTRAVRTNYNVLIEVRVESDSGGQELRVLNYRFSGPRSLRVSGTDRPVPFESVFDSVKVQHVRTSLLRKASPFPDDAISLPVEEVWVDYLEELRNLTPMSSHPVRVLVVRHAQPPLKPSFSDRPFGGVKGDYVNSPGNPIIAVLIMPEDGEAIPVLATDLYNDHSRQWGWYLLFPVTFYIDSVIIVTYIFCQLFSLGQCDW
jgi:hypothetical protein